MSDYQVTNYGICGECKYIHDDYDALDWVCTNEESLRYDCIVDYADTCECFEQEV